MAELPYSGGAPTVAPDTRVPDDYQHIQANPSSFGALTAHGTERLGAGLGEASKNLFDAAQFQGKINVDDQANQWITRKDTVLRGDPNKPAKGPDGMPVMGPDGKPQPDRGFMGLEGRAASEKRADTLKALEDTRLEGRKNLSSEYEKLLYDEQTRRMYSIAANSISEHADSQWKVWAGGVNETGAKLSLDAYVNNLSNPEEMKHHAKDYINFQVQRSQLKYGDDPTIYKATVAGAELDLLKARVDAVGVKDPDGALKILENHKAIAGTQYDDMYAKLRTRASEQFGIEVAKQKIGLSPTPLSQETADFFRARSGARVEGLNPEFAGRLQRATADYEAQTGQRAKFESLTRTGPEQAVLRWKYEHGVGGLAAPAGQSRHEFGQAADIADGPFRRWLHQNAGMYGLSFLGGKSFNDDPGHIQMAGGGVPGAVARPGLEPEADVLRRVFDDPRFANDTHARTAAITEVKRFYDAHQVQAANYNASFDQRLRDNLAQAGATGKPGAALGQDEFVSRFGPDKGPIAYNEYQAEVDLAAQTRTLSSMSPDQSESLLTSLKPRENEPGYADALKRHDRVAAAAQGLAEQKRKDPGQYALQYLPAVQSAWKAFETVTSGPSSSPAAKQAAAQTFAAITRAEQSRVGVPEAAQTILPKPYAEAVKADFASASSADDPAIRMGLISKIQHQAQTWGPAWPEVMRQLAPEVTPMTRAIAAGADPVALGRLLGLPKGEKSPSIILKEQSETKFSDVTEALNEAMTPFRRTLVGRQRDADEPGYFKLGQELSALYVRDGDDATVAAGKSFNALVGNRYEFRDTWRVPKDIGVGADDVQKGTVAARGQMRAASENRGGLGFDVAEAIDDAGLRENNRADSLQKFARDGKFVTSYDNAGLNLVYDDKFVRNGNGAPVLLTWAELAAMGNGKPSQVPPFARQAPRFR